MAEADPEDLAIFKLYLATAEKISDRRLSANTWMLSVNSAVVALYGYTDQAVGTAGIRSWAIPAAGILVCLAWAALLQSYRTLNAAKFLVLHDLEAGMGLDLFAAERRYYKRDGRRSLAKIETWIPWSFVFLYVCALGVEIAI